MAAPAPAIATTRPGPDPKSAGKPEAKPEARSGPKSPPKPDTGSEKKPGATEWIMPIAAVGLIFVMLIPLPTLLLDLLLALSIAVSVLVLLSAIQILRPSQFSVFPSLILLLTLFRLSLNLASSRRILLHGNEGVAAAGHVIEAFGQFVVGGNYVVGFVLFVALIAIQYLVVAHGAVRTAEVTARFTLDAMPGKQMAIDADLNAGLINEGQARERRQQIARDAEFYGAMDGAARFSQRDSIATILITAINIIAGFLIGVFQLDIPFREALKTYTVLTVGDGLVTMIPSLLVSMAGGMVVTRATSDATLSADMGRQVLSRRIPLWVAAGVMLALAAIPGLPKVSFLLLSVGMAFLAWRAPKLAAEAALAPLGDKKAGKDKPGEKEKDKESVEDLLKLDELSLEVGYGLVPLVDQNQGGQLLARVRALRQNLAQQLGFIVPPVHITDNVRLKPREYVIALRGVEIARWEMYQDQLMAISSEGTPRPLAGVPTKEPAFGVAALWIPPALQNQALASGYAVVDQTSVLATHLAEVVKQHAYELLSRQEVKRLLDRLAEGQPKLVEELVPKVLSLGEVQKVLQQLLREQVSIRDLTTILEALLDTAPANKQPVLLVEVARQALGRALVRPLLSEGGGLRVVTLDHALEEELARAFGGAAIPVSSAGMQPPFARRILEGLRRVAGEQVVVATPVVLCPSPARYHLKRLLEPFLPKVVVLSPLEVPALVEVQSVGVLR
jgi:flagellar biosynthesis protein FlhA